MRARFAGATLLLAILSAALLPTLAVAQSAPAATPSSLIVKVIAGLTTDQQAEIVARNGGTLTSSIPALRLLVVTVLVQDVDATLARYQADTQVQSVEQNKVRVSESVPSDPLYVNQWALPKIGWDQVFGVVTPTGSAKVALLDTGVDASHPELADKIVAGTSILDGSDGRTDPSGHGTWLAGIIAAQTDNGAEGIAGVAYAGVQIVPVTVLNANGEGQDSDVIAGVVWAADHGADVILMAFSAPDFSQNLQDAIAYAWSKGAVAVAAVGNNAVNAPTFPAGDRGVMGVAATDQNDALASFSNDGQAVFIAAPGVQIQTIDINGAYIVIDGTSASAAYVAGLAAFMKAVDPTLTNGVIVGRIARNADPAGTQDQTGNGRINMPRALADTSTEFIEPAGAVPVGAGGPFIGPYTAAANARITVTFAGKGGGTVTINPGGDSLTSSGFKNETTGVSYTLSATPDNSSSFAGWSSQSGNITGGNCSGTASCGPFTLSANSGVTATFNALPSQTITITQHAPASAIFGSSFTVKATASSGLLVSIAGSGSCSGSGSDSGGGVSITMTNGVGTCTVTYSQAGNNSFAPAPNVVETTNANKAPQTITVTQDAPANATFNTSFIVKATASSALAVSIAASGACTGSGTDSGDGGITDPGVSITMSSGTGTCTVTYSQPGNNLYLAVSPNVVQTTTAQKANQAALTLTGAASPLTYNTTEALSTSGGTTNGTVTYNTAAPCSIVSGNQLHADSGTGTCSVTATMAGNANYNDVTSAAVAVTLAKADQAALTLTGAASPLTYNTTEALSTSGGTTNGTVTYNTAAPCSIVSGNQLHADSGTGTCSVTATMAGNANYNDVTSAAVAVTLAKADQAITFAALADETLGDPDFNVSATASSGLPVSFVAVGSCTIAGTAVHITTVGLCTITASQAGDNNYNAAQNVSQTFTIKYGFFGLQSPYVIPAQGAFQVKSAIPLKWQYLNNTGSVINSSAANPIVSIVGPYFCGGDDTAAPTILVNDAGNSGYQYDATTNTWQFNWKTTGLSVGCYNISIHSNQSGQNNGPYPIQLKNK